jgi:hypothetical protein
MEHPPFLSRIAFKGLPGLVIEIMETTIFDSPLTSTNGVGLMHHDGSSRQQAGPGKLKSVFVRTASHPAYGAGCKAARHCVTHTDPVITAK